MSVREAEPLLLDPEDRFLSSPSQRHGGGFSVQSEQRAAQRERKAKAKKAEDKYEACKNGAFISIGILTLLYTAGELGIGLWLHSLSLLSDGFHNLSDVIALAIGYMANKAAKKEASDKYSYGWARTELLGALTNACFLLSLSLYILLEAIPNFIDPQPIEAPGVSFVATAAAGVALNACGTIVFAVTGKGHSHSHGHGHGHGHADEGKAKKKKKSKKGADYHDDALEMGLSAHEHSHAGGGSHEHSHGGGGGGHEHAHSNAEEEEEAGSGHSHSHTEKISKGEHDGHSHGGHGGHGEDMNIRGVMLHFLGDAISSVFVLGVGLLNYFFDPSVEGNKWVLYIDPTASVIIVVIILWTTIPLVKSVAEILLQKAPSHIDVPELKRKVRGVPGIISSHDMHIWQLVDGMTIASLHVDCEDGADFGGISKQVRKAFHKQGIHSVTIQPEFVHPQHPGKPHCDANCVDDCEEAWCCKTEAERYTEENPEVPLNDGVNVLFDNAGFASLRPRTVYSSQSDLLDI